MRGSLEIGEGLSLVEMRCVVVKNGGPRSRRLSYASEHVKRVDMSTHIVRKSWYLLFPIGALLWYAMHLRLLPQPQHARPLPPPADAIPRAQARSCQNRLTSACPDDSAGAGQRSGTEIVCIQQDSQGLDIVYDDGPANASRSCRHVVFPDDHQDGEEFCARGNEQRRRHSVGPAEVEQVRG
jgi:hypothetical protein